MVGNTVVAMMIEETMKFRDACSDEVQRHNRNTSHMISLNSSPNFLFPLCLWSPMVTSETLYVNLYGQSSQ